MWTQGGHRVDTGWTDSIMSLTIFQRALSTILFQKQIFMTIKFPKLFYFLLTASGYIFMAKLARMGLKKAILIIAYVKVTISRDGNFLPEMKSPLSNLLRKYFHLR